MFLTPQQKMRIIIITISYIFLFGFIRLVVINKKMNINDFLINGILLFIWLGLSTALTNYISITKI